MSGPSEPATLEGRPGNRPRPAILLRGVGPMSRLGRIATEQLADIANIAFSDGAPAEPKRWRQALYGTALQWWADSGAGPRLENPEPVDVTLDQHQQAAGQAGRTWCIVDAAGVPLFHPFQALRVCRMEPYIASLNLIESRDGGATWLLIAEVHVSSARSYPALLDVLGRTAMRLLRMALCDGGVPASPWVPQPIGPGLSRTLLGAGFASGLAWLLARIGGEVYGIAVLDRRPEEFLHDQSCPVAHWLQIPASKGFIADPFFWPGRADVLLCETYLHRTGLGELTLLQVDAGRIIGSEPLPLGLGCHLSYPSAWTEDGRVFCLPEMAASRRQILYELLPGMPPQPLCVIADRIGMADPTLMKVNGLYWIAYTDTDIGTYDNLCLLHASRLEGPWSPHAGNPVKIDARSSRPGGTPFWVGDQLFRPTQDCSREYGGALIINHVKVCTEQAYQETAVAILRPDPNGAFPDGLHTLSISDGRAVIDGKRNSYHPAILGQKLRRRLVRTSGRPHTNMAH